MFLTPCHCDRLPRREARLRRPPLKPSQATVLRTPIGWLLRKLVISIRSAVSKTLARHKQYYLRRGAEQASHITHSVLALISGVLGMHSAGERTASAS